MVLLALLNMQACTSETPAPPPVEEVFIPLSKPDQLVSHAVMSPDGKTVYYTVMGTANRPWQMYAADVSSASSSFLFFFDNIYETPKVSADGKLITFVNAGDVYELMLYQVEQNSLSILASGDHVGNSFGFVGNQRVLYYNRSSATNCVCSSLWSVEPSGTDAALYFQQDSLWISMASPDGVHLVYSPYSSSDWGIIKLDNTIVAHHSNSTFTPVAFSPDGSRLLLQKLLTNGSGSGGPQIGRRVGLYLADAKGNNPVALVGGDADLVIGGFSGDGKKILFSGDSGLDGSKGSINPELYTINIDGSGLTRLTHNDYNEQPLGFADNDTKVVFKAILEHNPSLYLLNIGSK